MSTRYNIKHKEKMFNEFKSFIEKENYIMLSDSIDYVNAKSKLEMLCPEKHHISINRNNWLSGKRCGACAKGGIGIVNGKRKCTDCGKWLILDNFHKGKEKCKKCRLMYQRTEKGKKEQRKRNKKWEQSEKGKIFNKKYKLTRNLSNSIRQSLNGNKNGEHWEDLVEYTLQELKIHLESLFQLGMNWNNHGLYGWHIDHIRPISSFNITDYNCKDFKKCWSLSNLQPLWAEENMTKGNKYEIIK